MTATNPADEHVQRLITLTERLTQQIALDADAFEARRSHEAADRMEQTAKLANLYRHEAARMKQDPRVVAAASAELRRRLIRASESFEAVLARHGRALHAAKTITEGIVRAIAEEADRARTAVAGYGPGARTQAAAAAPIALNRRA
jgi:hypothetical protein